MGKKLASIIGTALITLSAGTPEKSSAADGLQIGGLNFHRETTIEQRIVTVPRTVYTPTTVNVPRTALTETTVNVQRPAWQQTTVYQQRTICGPETGCVPQTICEPKNVWVPTTVTEQRKAFVPTTVYEQRQAWVPHKVYEPAVQVRERTRVVTTYDPSKSVVAGLLRCLTEPCHDHTTIIAPAPILVPQYTDRCNPYQQPAPQQYSPQPTPAPEPTPAPRQIPPSPRPAMNTRPLVPVDDNSVPVNREARVYGDQGFRNNYSSQFQSGPYQPVSHRQPQFSTNNNWVPVAR